MTRADRVLIAAIAVAALLAWPLAARAAGSDASSVEIAGPAGVSVLRLDADTVVAVDGHLGTVRVRIKDGSVWVTESCCPNHVCVRTGAISSPGSVVACVPNGVTVSIGGSDRVGLDTLFH